jgi:hypothetical protein
MRENEIEIMKILGCMLGGLFVGMCNLGGGMMEDPFSK